MSTFLSSLSNALSGNTLNEEMPASTDEARLHPEERLHPDFNAMAVPPEAGVRPVAMRQSVRKAKPKATPVRPPPKISQMVQGAIVNLKERFGSSVDTIVTFLVRKYRVNPQRARLSVRRYVANAFKKGDLLRITRDDHPATFKLKPSVLKTYLLHKCPRSRQALLSTAVTSANKRSTSANSTKLQRSRSIASSSSTKASAKAVVSQKSKKNPVQSTAAGSKKKT